MGAGVTPAVEYDPDISVMTLVEEPLLIADGGAVNMASVAAAAPVVEDDVDAEVWAGVRAVRVVRFNGGNLAAAISSPPLLGPDQLLETRQDTGYGGVGDNETE